MRESYRRPHGRDPRNGRFEFEPEQPANGSTARRSVPMIAPEAAREWPGLKRGETCVENPARSEEVFALIRPSRSSTQGASEVETARFRPELFISAQPWVRSWERIARMRALGSQPPPPAPGWRGCPDKPYPGIRLAIVRRPTGRDFLLLREGAGVSAGGSRCCSRHPRSRGSCRQVRRRARTAFPHPEGCPWRRGQRVPPGTPTAPSPRRCRRHC